MPTTPNGFWYPDRYDTVNSISGLFAQQAASADAALDNRMLKDGVPKFTSATERDIAFATYPPVNGSMAYLESTGEYERWSGTAWVPAIKHIQPFITLLAEQNTFTGTEAAFTTFSTESQYGDHGVTIGPGTKGAASLLLVAGSYDILMNVEHSVNQTTRYYTGLKWDNWGNALGNNAFIQDGYGTRFIAANKVLHPNTTNRPLYAVSTYATVPAYIQLSLTIKRIS